MKKIILVILFGTLTIQIKAQLKADAGFNLFLCDSFGKSIIAPLISNRTNKLLGGNPTAWGGIPPYKYKWTFSYVCMSHDAGVIHRSTSKSHDKRERHTRV